MQTRAPEKDILGFMYAERLKSGLLAAEQLLEAMAGLEEVERRGGLKVFAAFCRALSGEMRLAASVMRNPKWQGIEAQFNLVEGYLRLQRLAAARRELSQTLSRVTTLSGRAMASLRNAGLL